MYFVGKISDHSFVENSGTYSSSDPSDSAILTNIKARIGGVASDYSVYHIANTGTIVDRIMAGDQFNLVWTGDIVTEVSFLVEDAKKWLNFSTNKTSVKGDNYETFTVKVDVLLANKSGTDTSFNSSLDIVFGTPDGSSTFRFYFLNGKSSRNYTSSKSGLWTLPLNKLAGYRNNNSVSVTSIE